MLLRRLMIASAAIAALALLAGCAASPSPSPTPSALTAARLRAALLPRTAVPAGPWNDVTELYVPPSGSGAVGAGGGADATCGDGSHATWSAAGDRAAGRSFVSASSVSVVEERLFAAGDAASQVRAAKKAMAACPSGTETLGGVPVSFTAAPVRLDVSDPYSATRFVLSTADGTPRYFEDQLLIAHRGALVVLEVGRAGATSVNGVVAPLVRRALSALDAARGPASGPKPGTSSAAALRSMLPALGAIPGGPWARETDDGPTSFEFCGLTPDVGAPSGVPDAELLAGAAHDARVLLVDLYSVASPARQVREVRDGVAGCTGGSLQSADAEQRYAVAPVDLGAFGDASVSFRLTLTTAAGEVAEIGTVVATHGVLVSMESGGVSDAQAGQIVRAVLAAVAEHAR